jgi:2-keto-4-pentenoate hydratase/2-oxohepta-3-ene-1,7-dioic acid hydratase in catechol pathway
MLPIDRPGKIVCVGLNYRDHAEEQGAELPEEPLLFAKWPNALIGPGDPIVIPPLVTRCDYEAELGVVIGETVTRVSKENALEAVRGYVCANDVSARNLQAKDKQWLRAKGFDTFCPVASEVLERPDIAQLALSTRVNGEERQCATAAEMVFSIPELLSYISHIMTLEPGDLVATGTPAGVGPLHAGDTVEVEVRCGARTSRVANPVVADA